MVAFNIYAFGLTLILVTDNKQVGIFCMFTLLTKLFFEIDIDKNIFLIRLILLQSYQHTLQGIQCTMPINSIH